MTAKAVRHEEGDSEFIGNPFFSCIHSKFSCLTSWLWSHCKSRELAGSLWAGSEDFPMVQKAYFFIYWVFNSFQPRPKHFYQTVFCGNRATTRLFQLGVKKRTRLENNSVNGQHRMRWPAGAWLVHPLKCLDSAESRSLAALIHLLVLCTRVNEVHLIQRQGPIRLRDWPKKVIKN